MDLFAGIGGLRRSLELLGIIPEVSVVCETSDAAVRVLLHQWPDSVLWGSCSDISRDSVVSLARSHMHVDSWIIGGGFECQAFSGLNPSRSEFSDPRGQLFHFVNSVAGFR